MYISLYSFLMTESNPQLGAVFYEVNKRYDDCCNNIGTNGQLHSGEIFLRLYQNLEKSDNFTSKSMKLACTLAWCIEMITVVFILEDDIIDGSVLRWNRLCWHEKPEIGLTALIHARQIRVAIFKILRKYFTEHSFYKQLIHLFCETTYKTALGQTLDINTSRDFKKRLKLNLFTTRLYESITYYKTEYLMYHLPFLAALYLTQRYEYDHCKTYNSCVPIMNRLAIYTQVQNDMLDVFGNYDNYGKLGTDIENGKCTWPIITAISYANECQLKLLEKHYGRNELSSKQFVLDMYKKLDLLNKFFEYKYDLVKDLKKEIDHLPYEPIRRAFQETSKQDVEACEDFVKY